MPVLRLKAFPTMRLQRRWRPWTQPIQLNAMLRLCCAALPPGAGGPAGAEQLPGTGGKRAPVVRTRCVTLSPTGRAWAAATTEGLLLYRCAPCCACCAPRHSSPCCACCAMPQPTRQGPARQSALCT